MKSIFWIWPFVIALITQLAAAAPLTEKGIRGIWQFKDLSATPALSVFLNNAHAVLTLRARLQENSATDAKPAVFVYRIRVDRNVRLMRKQDWAAFLASQIKPGLRTELAADTSTRGRYFTESINKQGGKGPVIHSLYLLMRTKSDEVVLFVYDHVGTPSRRNLRLVRDLYSGMNANILKHMYRN